MKKRTTTRLDDHLSWFPYFPADFEEGTSEFTLVQVGAYQRLLNVQWARGGIRADDIGALSRLLRCSTAGAKTAWEAIRTKFVKGDDGLWRNQRLERVRAAQKLRRWIAKVNGASGGKKRWAKERDAEHSDSHSKTHSDPNRVATDLVVANEYQIDSSPDPDLQIKERSEDSPRTVPKTQNSLRGRFDVFWAEYPRKKARAAAWSAWQRLKPSAELTAEMLTAIRSQRGTREWREGFIPHPATWLNQARWTDEQDQREPSASPPIPFWDECAKCSDIHPVGQPCPAKGERP